MALALVVLASRCGKERIDSEVERCKGERASIVAMFAASTQCAVDADCEVLHTACGLPGDCGGVAVTRSAAPMLAARSSMFLESECARKVVAPEECPDQRDHAMWFGRCEPKGPALCSNGTCKGGPPKRS